ncbi:hypothetical protein GCM10009869_17330 [Amnibacterium kyonggiense]
MRRRKTVFSLRCSNSTEPKTGPPLVVTADSDGVYTSDFPARTVRLDRLSNPRVIGLSLLPVRREEPLPEEGAHKWRRVSAGPRVVESAGQSEVWWLAHLTQGHPAALTV